MKQREKIINNLINWGIEVDLNDRFSMENLVFSNNNSALKEADQSLVWLEIAAALDCDVVAFHLISNLNHAVVNENYEYINTMKADAVSHIDFDENNIEDIGRAYFDQLLDGMIVFKLFSPYKEELVSIASLWLGYTEEINIISDKISAVHKKMMSHTKYEVSEDAIKHITNGGLETEHPLFTMAKLDRFFKLMV